MALDQLVQWWNLIFLLPLLVAVLLSLLLAVLPAIADHGIGADADAEVGHDLSADVDADHDLSHDVHSGAWHVAGQSHGEGVEAHHESGWLSGILLFLGLGRVPLSILLMSWFYVWGLSGWISNQIVSSFIPNPGYFVWLSLVIALVASVTLTRYLAIGLGRLIPSTESYGVSNAGLVGEIAHVRFPITQASGAAQVYDKYGNLHEVDCLAEPGQLPIPAGEEVVLFDYDRERRVFRVIRKSELTIE